jgi:ribonucleoside-diphosphate reductase alpha chain
MMRDAQVPVEDCVMNPDSTAVFTFTQAAPSGSLTQNELYAIDHLNLWLTYQEHYCQHKPSITVNYADNEFLPVGQWVWDNFDKISGISFLPKSDHVYAQAPFESISLETYNEFPVIDVDFNNLSLYEKTDTTTSSHTLACTAGACEIIDLRG